MGVVTAAVIAGAATVASTGAGIAASQGAFGGGSSSGGSGSGGNFAKTPMDPQQRAMRDYYARMAVVNQNSNYPGFGEYLTSGGDPAKAQFDLQTPGMKPSEAAALGLVGGHGEAIPYYDQETMPSSLTPEQRLYAAKERIRHARETGSKMPQWTWAEATVNAADRYKTLQDRLNAASSVSEADRTQKQNRQIANIPGRLEDISSRHANLNLGG